MTWIVIVAAALVTVALVVWFFAAKRVPESAASHAGPRVEDESGRGTQPGDVVERPGGPGAESQRVDGHGTLRPGP